MISIETARSGHPVLRKDGRYLSSSYDPVKEAVAWVDRAVIGLGASETVFVLGLGSGYHAEELAKRISPERVTVLECDPEIAASGLRLCQLIKSDNLVVEPTWVNLPDNGRFRDFACGVFRIAAHGPSCQIDPVFYDRVEMLLLGREWTSFLLQLKMRPELLASIDHTVLARLRDEPATIKTMKKLFAGQPLSSRERMLWRVLEELIT